MEEPIWLRPEGQPAPAAFLDGGTLTIMLSREMLQPTLCTQLGYLQALRRGQELG